jgi:hypothetical protein
MEYADGQWPPLHVHNIFITTEYKKYLFVCRGAHCASAYSFLLLSLILLITSLPLKPWLAHRFLARQKGCKKRQEAAPLDRAPIRADTDKNRAHQIYKHSKNYLAQNGD